MVAGEIGTWGCATSLVRVGVDEALPGPGGAGGGGVRAPQVLHEGLALAVLRVHHAARHAHRALRHLARQRVTPPHHPARTHARTHAIYFIESL